MPLAFFSGTRAGLDEHNAALSDVPSAWTTPFATNTVSVVRTTTGVVVATLTGNGLSHPGEAAFDGERILITNPPPVNNGNTVSLWKAADFSPLGSVQVSLGQDDVSGVCSDGLNFWITLRLTGKLARF